MKSKILNKVLFIVVIGMVMAFTTNDAMFKSTSVIVTSESSLVVCLVLKYGYRLKIDLRCF
ncbi:hypothetical protein [Aestuariivivens sp. NBU2969]|uniref:hypothetical protein n=1 Tax=Aestuariivivens sp. NBU2969 TaxID=2873267 RepID=UPI001CBF3BBE|nr:hypothetical protein [Aestuariivivens sp. NBU2969]